MRSQRLKLPWIHEPIVVVAALLVAVASACEPVEAKTADDAPMNGVASPSPSTTPAQPSPHEADKQAAHTEADTWLLLVDQGKYGETWDTAAPVFQSATPKAQWEGAVQSARGPLGALTSRKYVTAEYKGSLPGAPPGEYVIVYYDTVFASKPRAQESVTLTKTPDGAWKVAGYFVQ
jgi:hypothetical protein